MRHIDDGSSKTGKKPLEFMPDLLAQYRIQVAQRLVKQKYLWIPDKRSSRRDTLPLAAAQLPRRFFEQVLDLEQLRCVVNAPYDFVAGRLFQHEIERQIFIAAPVRIKSAGLKDHGYIAGSRREGVYHPQSRLCLPTAGPALQ